MVNLERLTECEQLVMKTLWDAGEELSLMDIVQRINGNGRYRKNWKPQTVSTFLARLVRKGYLRHYRQGRLFFYQILIPLDEYKGQLTSDYVDFWNHGNADEFLSALIEERRLRPDEIERIQTLLAAITHENCASKQEDILTRTQNELINKLVWELELNKEWLKDFKDNCRHLSEKNYDYNREVCRIKIDQIEHDIKTIKLYLMPEKAKEP